MKKFVIKGLICVLSICAILGAINLMPVKAEQSSVADFKIIGAGIRKSFEGEDKDLSGLRFTTTLTQSAYNQILSSANGSKVYFGTEVTTTVEGSAMKEFCYVSSSPSKGEVSPHFDTGIDGAKFEYYASITFNKEEFRKALADKLNVDVSDNRLDEAVEKYIKQAYGTQLKATSFYKIDGKKYYTGSVVRSISMVANYYANTPGYQEDYESIANKNYFTKSEVEVTGTISSNGKVALKNYDISGIEQIAYNAQALTFTKVGELIVELNEITLDSEIKLYAFNANNEVTTLNLKVISESAQNASIAGNNLIDYKIAVDTNNETTNKIALSLQSAINGRIGYQPELIGLEGIDSNDKVIIVRQVAKAETHEDGYKCFVENGNLIIECAYITKFEEAVSGIISQISDTDIAFNFKADEERTVEVSKVYYSDFGVVGDGVTDDFLAMKATHKEANKHGQTVVGEAGKTYYIGDAYDPDAWYSQAIDVKTDVDFRGATIIIDDNKVLYEEQSTDVNGEPITNAQGVVYKKAYNNHIFNIQNDYTTNTITDATEIANYFEGGKIIKGQTTQLKTPLGYDALLIVKNSNKKTFIRSGSYNSEGGSQQEILFVDKDGNIQNATATYDNFTNFSSDVSVENKKNVTTNFLADMDEITSIEIIRADTNPVTIQNAKVITYANTENQYGKSYAGARMRRGFKVSRPNTTVLNITHEVQNEESRDGGKFVNYWHTFFEVENTYNVLIENCEFTGRTRYESGTYDLYFNSTHSLILKNCTQSNFWATVDKSGSPLEENSFVNLNYPIWGIMGSNYCNNLVYDGCSLSRFDAHAGIVDAKVIGGKIGEICVTGGGSLLVKGVDIYPTDNDPNDENYKARNIITLRNDYGSFWDGTITLNDVDVINKTASGENKTAISEVIGISVTNHNYGYNGKFPNVIIDDIRISYPADKVYITDTTSAIFTDVGITASVRFDYSKNLYPYFPAEFITVQGNGANEVNIIVPTDNNFFINTKLTGVITERVYADDGHVDIRQENGQFVPGWLNVNLG